jgi:purine nucleoside permease
MVGLVFLYGFFYPEFTINVPKEVVKNTFLAALIPWVDPVQTTEYVQLQGLTIVMPLLVPISEAVLMIVGFYFGRK